MKTIIAIFLILFGTMALQAQELKPFKADNFKWGYKDQNGKAGVSLDGRAFYINKTGKEIK